MSIIDSYNDEGTQTSAPSPQKRLKDIVSESKAALDAELDKIQDISGVVDEKIDIVTNQLEAETTPPFCCSSWTKFKAQDKDCVPTMGSEKIYPMPEDYTCANINYPIQ